MDLNSTLANLIKHKINDSAVTWLDLAVSVREPAGSSCSKVLEICDEDMTKEQG